MHSLIENTLTLAAHSGCALTALFEGTSCHFGMKGIIYRHISIVLKCSVYRVVRALSMDGRWRMERVNEAIYYYWLICWECRDWGRCQKFLVLTINYNIGINNVSTDKLHNLIIITAASTL